MIQPSRQSSVESPISGYRWSNVHPDSNTGSSSARRQTSRIQSQVVRCGDVEKAKRITATLRHAIS